MRLFSSPSSDRNDRELRFPAWLDWFVAADLGLVEHRRARMVALVSAVSTVAMALLALSLWLSGTAPQFIQIASAVALFTLSLFFLRTGAAGPAAWITSLTLTATPLVQAALDGGIRDPAVAFVAVAPLVAAMTSGVRLAALCAALGSAGTAVLLAVHLNGTAPPAVSSDASLAWYAFLLASLGSLATAVAGAIYIRHTRLVIEEAETRAETLDSALRKSEARYRSLVDGLPIGLYRTSPDGRVLLANPAMARMIGASSPAEALGFHAATLYQDPAERVALQEAIRHDGFVRRYDTEWRTPGGGVRQVRIDARVTLGDDGEPLFYEGAVEDVTAERRARAATARSEARFRALVQRSSDLVVVLGTDGRLTYVSPAVRGFLGREADDLVGRDPLMLVHPEDRDDVMERLAGAIDGDDHTATPVEIRLRHSDGHFVYAEGVGAALYHDPAVNGLVVNFRDVTERRRAQAVLIQAKKQAEEVAHLKSTFLANMSHEIRTPLTAILGFSDVLMDEVMDPQHQEFVELISRAGKRLMDTLNSVLDLARLESGRGELACTPLHVGGAAQEAALLMGSVAAERGLTLTAVIEAPAAHALLDDAAFARVLHNLIGNALKFTESGGVTVRVCTGTGDAEGRIIVQVEDTGMGIDPDFLPRLFGEFEQASAGLERTHEGAGLGLAISRQLVERMSGTIDVASEVGSGTVFSVTFPRIDAPAPATARPRVLVVDDNDQARLVAERVLENHYDVVTAQTGEEALVHVRADLPDAILLDIHLGDTVSGEDVLRDVRADTALAGLPVIAMTAYGLPGDRARFLALGFDDYIAKPYTRERLLDAMADSLERRSKATA